MGAPAPFPLFPRHGPFNPGRPCPPPPRTRTGPPRAPAPLPPQALHALLADLMAPVADWGRVVLTVANGLAELQSTLECARGVADGIDVWHLRGERHAAWLSERGIARIELVEPAAGNAEGDAAAVHLSWHDRLGRRIGRLMLPCPLGRDQGLLWLRQHGHARADACRRRLATAPMPLMLVPHPGFTRVDTLARGPAAAAWANAAMRHLDRAAELRLDLGSVGAAVHYTGTLGAALAVSDGYHATGPQCSLSLQARQATAVARVVDRDGVSGLQFDDASGGRLLLHPQGAGAADWFKAVAALASDLAQAPTDGADASTAPPGP
ncbi:hypothetical protein RA210_U10099 [Rubrivivax sp. A210]|uniref:hypothetical protein n=1 Tax=Rubrivivax sp. A210 TaxID=2772301 RepID=UPI001918B305|nr:hypothetical protein [Rubrivivax sp. A210]CAD5365986.1 hypothetical protein RA210_U10099 [Rubrivivax sp. A210]